MKYLRTRPSDRIQIRELFKEYNLEYDDREPLIGFCAKDEKTLQIFGAAYAHKAAIIDPFICEQPLAALKIFMQTMGALSALDYHNVIVQVSAANTKLVEDMGRLGFEKVTSDYVIFKKVE